MRNIRFGFIQNNFYLTDMQLSRIRQALVLDKSQGIIKEYENRFSELIGSGYGVSFASGRMAFFSLLKMLNIGEGDEVILPGFTCSVMVNAVWRAGAIPIFSDIDRMTFGSAADEIKRKITSKTKLIVAQHSFGIPCSIAEIAEIAKKEKIYLVEDCALTFDAAINGITVGNWSDAAIFSTDHTKPINTLIGGFLYTREKQLYEKIKHLSSTLPELTKVHQSRLYGQFIFEQSNHVLNRFLTLRFQKVVFGVKKKLFAGQAKPVFLENDYTKKRHSNPGYPYPARMPPFLAQLGIFELERWKKEKERRKNILRRYLEIMVDLGLDKYIPKIYFQDKIEVVPLRFVFEHPESIDLLKKMSRFMDISKIWFRTPIVCCPGGPESLGYHYGECPTAEDIGRKILNWPCNIQPGSEVNFLELFRKILNN